MADVKNVYKTKDAEGFSFGDNVLTRSIFKNSAYHGKNIEDWIKSKGYNSSQAKEFREAISDLGEDFSIYRMGSDGTLYSNGAYEDEDDNGTVYHNSKDKQKDSHWAARHKDKVGDGKKYSEFNSHRAVAAYLKWIGDGVLSHESGQTEEKKKNPYSKEKSFGAYWAAKMGNNIWDSDRADIKRHLSSYLGIANKKGYNPEDNDDDFDDNDLADLRDIYNKFDSFDDNTLKKRLALYVGQYTLFKSGQDKKAAEDKAKAEADAAAAKEKEEAAKKEEEQKKKDQYVRDLLNKWNNNGLSYKGSWFTSSPSSGLFNEDGTYNAAFMDATYGTNGSTDAERKANRLKAYNSWVSNPFQRNAGDWLHSLRATNSLYLQDLGDGTFWVRMPKTEVSTGAGLIWNPTTNLLTRKFIAEILPAMDELILKYYLSNDPDKYIKLFSSFDEGGQIKYMDAGGDFWTAYDDLYSAAQKEKADINGVSTTTLNKRDRRVGGDLGNAASFGLSSSGAAKKSVNQPDAGFTAADRVRLGAIAGDVVSMLSSFAPGYGTAASLITGGGSSIAHLYADIASDGFLWGDIGRFVGNLGMDFLGAIPGFGATTKGTKIAKTLIKYVPRVLAVLSTVSTLKDAPEIAKSWEKLGKEGEHNKLTVQDWQNIARGIGLVAGIGRATSNKIKQQITKNRAHARDKVVVNTSEGRLLLAGKDASAMRLAIAKNSSEGILEAKNILKNYGNFAKADLGKSTKEWTRNGSWKPWKWNRSADGVNTKGILEEYYDMSRLRRPGTWDSRISTSYRNWGYAEPLVLRPTPPVQIAGLLPYRKIETPGSRRNIEIRALPAPGLAHINPVFLRRDVYERNLNQPQAKMQLDISMIRSLLGYSKQGGSLNINKVRNLIK